MNGHFVKYCHLVNSTHGVLYGFPKVYKSGRPFRPIVSSINTYNYHFKALTSNGHSSAIADHMTQTGHRIKWDHFDILATGQSDMIIVKLRKRC